jgi:pilus assembly protein CpaB
MNPPNLAQGEQEQGTMSTSYPQVRTRWRRWGRRMRRQRRLLAAALLAIATAVALQGIIPTERNGPLIAVTARDLPAGHRLTAADLTHQHWPAGTAPTGTVPHPEGKVLASPVRKGEPVTDARLTGRGLLTGQPTGTVAVAVRLADPAASGLIRPGDRVDVLSLPPVDGLPAATATATLAEAALVLAVGSRGGEDTDGSVGGTASGSGAGPWNTGTGTAGESGQGLLVLAVDRTTSATLAPAAASGVAVALVA